MSVYEITKLAVSVLAFE